jgi:hypothetical protein
MARAPVPPRITSCIMLNMTNELRVSTTRSAPSPARTGEARASTLPLPSSTRLMK